jgi:selenocysteine lyase/cysteine desulfurase
LVHELFGRDVVIDNRLDTVRMSPHFFNTEEDVDRAFEEIRVALRD